MRISVWYALLPALILGGCRKKPDPQEPPAPPQVKLIFENVVGDKPLVLDKESYVNANGDDFTVSTFKYYISNIKLANTEGAAFAEPESYHLIDAAKTHSGEMLLTDVDEGSYTQISFLIGVDSIRNISGAQTGALDPKHGMFWDWNTGYIMALMEGKAPKAKPNTIAFHMGGFMGPNNVVRKILLKLPSQVHAATGKTPEIHIKADLGEWFKTPSTVDFTKLSVVSTPEEDAKMIADNYADMFSVSEVK